MRRSLSVGVRLWRLGAVLALLQGGCSPGAARCKTTEDCGPNAYCADVGVCVRNPPQGAGAVWNQSSWNLSNWQ